MWTSLSASPEPSIQEGTKLPVFGIGYNAPEKLEQFDVSNMSRHSTGTPGTMTPGAALDDDEDESFQHILKEASQMQVHPWVQKLAPLPGRKRRSEWFEEERMEKLAANLSREFPAKLSASQASTDNATPKAEREQVFNKAFDRVRKEMTGYEKQTVTTTFTMPNTCQTRGTPGQKACNTRGIPGQIRGAPGIATGWDGSCGPTLAPSLKAPASVSAVSSRMAAVSHNALRADKETAPEAPKMSLPPASSARAQVEATQEVARKIGRYCDVCKMTSRSYNNY